MYIWHARTMAYPEVTTTLGTPPRRRRAHRHSRWEQCPAVKSVVGLNEGSSTGPNGDSSETDGLTGLRTVLTIVCVIRLWNT